LGKADDAWRTVCRYADDGLLHCKSRRQAEWVMAKITSRFKECGTGDKFG